MAIDLGFEAVTSKVMAHAHRIAHLDSSAGLPCLLVLGCCAYDQNSAAQILSCLFYLFRTHSTSVALINICPPSTGPFVQLRTQATIKGVTPDLNWMIFIHVLEMR